MLYQLTQFFKIHKSFFLFTGLNYLDKLLVFSLPLLVLLVSKDKILYNEIEYIFSFANIAVIIVDFGMRPYIFYGYKEALDRNSFINSSRECFHLLLLLNIVLAFCVFFLSMFFNISNLLIGFIIVRTLFLQFINFFSYYFRIVDNPSKIFFFSIGANLLSFLFIFVCSLTTPSLIMEAFFLPQVLVVMLAAILLFNSNVLRHFGELYNFLKRAIIYSWPILLNMLLISFMNNYGKIHAFNHLSASEMFEISYYLRFSLIIQMAHVSILGYYSKSLYLNINKTFDKSFIVLYSSVILVALVITVSLMFIVSTFNIVENLKIGTSFVIILFYMLLWNYQSLLELFFNKNNKNKYILLYSAISVVLFMLLIYFVGVSSTFDICVYMLVSVILNLSLLFWKFKVLVNELA